MSSAEGLTSPVHGSEALEPIAARGPSEKELRSLSAVGDRPLAGILIADDRTLLAEALRAALQEQGLQVLAIAGSAEETLRLAASHRPELALMNLSLPGKPGVELGERVMAASPGTKVMAVMDAKDPISVAEANGAGFHGYIFHDTPLSSFLSTIKASLSTSAVVPHRTRRISAAGPSSEDRDAALLGKQLTERELEVLGLLAEGRNGVAIGRALAITPNTVRTHVGNILTKLQVHSRLEAVTFAVRHRLVPGPSGLRRRSSDAHAVGHGSRRSVR